MHILASALAEKIACGGWGKLCPNPCCPTLNPAFQINHSYQCHFPCLSMCFIMQLTNKMHVSKLAKKNPEGWVWKGCKWYPNSRRPTSNPAFQLIHSIPVPFFMSFNVFHHAIDQQNAHFGNGKKNTRDGWGKAVNGVRIPVGKLQILLFILDKCHFACLSRWFIMQLTNKMHVSELAKK